MHQMKKAEKGYKAELDTAKPIDSLNEIADEVEF